MSWLTSTRLERPLLETREAVGVTGEVFSCISNSIRYLSILSYETSLPTISTAKYISKNWRSVCWPFAAQSQCLLLASLIHCSGTSVDKPYYTDRNYSHGIKNPSKYPSYIWTDPTKCEDIFLPPGYWRIYATNMFCHLFCKGMWC